MRRTFAALAIASASFLVTPVVASALTRFPAVGGQGTTFRLLFEPRCSGHFPEEGGVCDDEISLRGPQGTPCAGLLLGQPFGGYLYERLRFLLGPNPPRPAFESSVLAYRVVRAWCPGTYTGKVEENVFGRETVYPFAFRVRRTRPGEAGGRRRRGQDLEVPERPPVNPPGMHIRAISGKRVAVSFLVPPGGPPDQTNVSVELDNGPIDTRCGGDGPREEQYTLRAGPATLVIGGTGKRILGRHRRTLKTGGPLCPGRWIGWINDRGFTFVVR